MVLGRFKYVALYLEDSMKTFWRQGLLIGIATVAVGCTGPQSKLSVEERWLAAGYPAEYIDGLNAGGEAFCRELVADKGSHLLPPPKIFSICLNLATKAEKKPRENRSHQQGWADGKALMSFAIDTAREEEVGLQMQVQAGYDYMKYQRNMEFLNHKK